MKNKGVIIIGLIIFFVIVTVPLWWNFGADAEAPEPELTEKAKQAEKCVEATEYMTTEHMQLLDDWRERVVRHAERTYINSQGKKFDMSLTDTCLDCHSNKDKFCDKCHDYASVRPYCWDCHNTKETE
ncbi:MAG: sulfate reduction electron transfer complex DsrMKJOP subunit DsrJ [Desulfosudaceae bacterium]